ncbi:trypco2 family protein [Streptomyces sp. NPDC059479]|uniref:trypco2 family protein n=1 Tax=Streptomyces sp. NPDC059479 TaxID=3346848 RepID=UPI00368DB83A
MAVELAEMIGQLRAELTEAMRQGENENADLRFELGPVELELTISVDKEAGPGAKVRFWVVELGADAKIAQNSTQRITLTLDPRRAREPDRRPLISGAEVDGER